MVTDCAVIPSTESTGRSTIESGAASVPSGIRITGNCQTWWSYPLSWVSRRTIASARRSRASLSGVSEQARTCIAAIGAIPETGAITRFTSRSRLISSVARAWSSASIASTGA